MLSFPSTFKIVSQDVVAMASAKEQENKSPTATTATSESKGHVYEEPGYFQFPFTPYGIQVKFMQNLYSVLESGGVGIFESPTGTVS